ncbi:MAG: type VI secretion system baseplate subunit TssK [Gemmatimonadota bacterium]|jgi:type VI secretion system protein ImpJ|nr:type VI secretion system baseplate subunit TssK [Gemmatimonadota bacterium]
MTTLSRVVWSEGMHLAQHHFQTQNRYFEDLVSFTVSHLFYKPYGLVAVGLDADALLNGTAALIHGRGVLPDGLVFDLPADGLPPPLPIREIFSPTQDGHLLLLGIPAFRPTRSNTAQGNRDADARFIAVEERVSDETTGSDEKQVGVAKKNLRLLLDGEAAEGLVTMPIARIVRDGAGHFVYDPDYIPPTMRVSGSARLMDMIARLAGILEAKADALIAERGSGEYGQGEISNFWLSHTVHTGIGPLRHFLTSGDQSPEELYIELARLAGALCTFSLHSDARSLPAYDHDRPGECFGTLDRHIRAHLEVTVPTNVVTVRLQASDNNLWAGEIVDRRCFDRGALWFLAVRSSLPVTEVITRTPRLAKVCSSEHIVKLVQRGHPGLALEYVQVPPREISARAGTQYFSIASGTSAGPHPCWNWIAETSRIGVFAPDALPDVELELVVVLGS